ncbi:S-adenosyl-L-methionine-dependent methyltransferase [Glomus cerebriforme]|uniref:S-adenosyl-L-methionine-dependent methyltransferase n=1 Tax=Glomus cerebriforme TaxID=658196 RepID=A0A397SDM7_9GLOM|nr:S-adenosyl-L-methionine-dependent methyltransferase [Glomus cerebriforme]
MDFEVEYKRNKIIHELMKGIWGGNFTSPIKQELTNRKDFKVLDVGCGNSCPWVLELSKDYPLAKFIGFDILPLYPKGISQNNFQFIQGDILKGLPFENDSIDFVHMRCLLPAFTERQWEEIVIKELVRVCKPGGWVELIEIDVDGKSLGPTSKRLITAYFPYYILCLF